MVEGASVPFLALCDRSASIWHARDAQRQLVHALSEQRARRFAPRRLVRLDLVLGYGHYGKGDDRGDLPLDPGALDLYRASNDPIRYIPDYRPRARRDRRNRGIWPRRPRLLRVSAAEHQLRRERIPSPVGGNGRGVDCVL